MLTRGSDGGLRAGGRARDREDHGVAGRRRTRPCRRRPASIQKVDGTLLMGLTGATDGTKGTVTGMSLDQWCKKRNQKKAKTSCQVFDVATLDKITGLHITRVKDNGDAVCMPTQPRR